MSLVGVYALIMLSTLFWGANFVLAGFVLTDISPQWSAALRFGLAALILLAIAFSHKAPLAALIRQHGASYLTLGIIGVAGFNLLFFYAMQTTSADNAALIMATNPLLTTFLAWLVLGEHPGLQRLIALPLALLGVTVVISDGNLAHLRELHVMTGDWLMLVANLCWAFYNVLNRRLMPKNVSPTVNTALIISAGALVLLVVASFDTHGIHSPTLTTWLAMAGLVITGTVLAYLLWNTGIARLGAGRTALFMNLIPVFAMLSAITIGTYPTPMQLVGGAIVLCGLLISMIPNRKKPSAVLEAA